MMSRSSSNVSDARLGFDDGRESSVGLEFEMNPAMSAPVTSTTHLQCLKALHICPDVRLRCAKMTVVVCAADRASHHEGRSC